MARKKNGNTDDAMTDKAPMTSGTVEEIDRLRLSEINGQVLTQKNAAVALETDLRRLQMEAELVETRRQEAVRIGVEKQKDLHAMTDRLREQYNIPPTHGIRFSDGAVVPNPQPGGPGAAPAPRTE